MTVLPGQLALDGADADTARLSKSEAGLAKVPPGPERLLGEMVRRGLDREHLHAAAAIVLALDEPREASR